MDFCVKVWEAVLGQIEAMESVLYEVIGKAGMGGLTTGLIMLIFWFYVAWKIYELWIAQVDDTFTRKLWYIFNQYRRIMVVYVLVLAAPVLTMAVGGTATGFARSGRDSVVSACTPIFKTLDQLMGEAAGYMDSIGLQLAARAGGRDMASPTAWQWFKGGAQGAVDGMTLGTNQLIPGVQSGASSIQGYMVENAARAARADANNLLRVERSARLAMDAQKALLAGAEKRKAPAAYIQKLQDQMREMRAGLRSAEQTAIYGTDWEGSERKEIWYGLQAAWEADAVTLPIGMAQEEVARQLAGKSPGGQIFSQFQLQGGWGSPEGKAGEFLLSELSKATEAEIASRKASRGWQNDIPIIGWQIVGILGILIVLVGIIATAVNVFKAAYGVVFYCITFMATVIFAVGIASPLSPVFMLCFISDKTEPYGRNFVNFMLGGVFASMGMMLMAKTCAGLFVITSQYVLATGAYYLSQLIQHTDSMGSYFLACLTIAGALIIGGMAFTFLADFVKKGAAIGSGLFTGHFPA